MSDSLRDADTIETCCGVYGIVGKQHAARAVFFALYALNHREFGRILKAYLSKPLFLS